MTERQAWLALAKMWDEAEPDCEGDYCVDGLSYGLCYSIDAPRISASEDVKCNMLDKVHRHPKSPRSKYLFKWPTSKDGAKSRAAFCRKQAELLAPKKRKARKSK